MKRIRPAHSCIDISINLAFLIFPRWHVFLTVRLTSVCPSIYLPIYVYGCRRNAGESVKKIRIASEGDRGDVDDEV